MRLVRKTVAFSLTARITSKVILCRRVAGQTTNHFICTSDHTSDTNADPNTAPENAHWHILIQGTYSSTLADRQYAFFMGLSS